MEWRLMEFVPLRKACLLLCESVRTFYRRVADGKYPRPVKNGSRTLVSVRWLAPEVDRRHREFRA